MEGEIYPQGKIYPRLRTTALDLNVKTRAVEPETRTQPFLVELKLFYKFS